MTTIRTALPLARPDCAGAERLAIERILRNTPGVLNVFVNPLTEMAYVEYDPADTEPDALRNVLGRAGFTCPPEERSHPTW